MLYLLLIYSVLVIAELFFAFFAAVTLVQNSSCVET
jgi:hypothetical protein